MLAVLFGFALTYFLVYKNDFIVVDKSFDWSVNKIGNQMLATGENGYALPFEVVSILLLAAMIGCIVIASPSNPPKGREQRSPKLNGITEIKNIDELKAFSVGEDSGGVACP